MIATLKSLQIVCSLEVIVLFGVVYPGVMKYFAMAVGLVYLLAAIGAAIDTRVAIWAALSFSTLTALLAALGVARFVGNGFDYLTGGFSGSPGLYWLPYLLLLLTVLSAAVVALQALAWRWVVTGIAAR